MSLSPLEYLRHSPTEAEEAEYLVEASKHLMKEQFLADPSCCATSAGQAIAALSTATLLPTDPASIPGHSERSEESLPAFVRAHRGILRGRPTPREILRSARQEAGSTQNDSLLRLISCAG